MSTSINKLRVGTIHVHREVYGNQNFCFLDTLVGRLLFLFVLFYFQKINKSNFFPEQAFL